MDSALFAILLGLFSAVTLAATNMSVKMGHRHSCRAGDPSGQRGSSDPPRRLLSLMEAAKVSALRETAVVFAAALGTRLLGESFGRPRLLAALVLAAGLILMQFGA